MGLRRSRAFGGGPISTSAWGAGHRWDEQCLAPDRPAQAQPESPKVSLPSSRGCSPPARSLPYLDSPLIIPPDSHQPSLRRLPRAGPRQHLREGADRVDAQRRFRPFLDLVAPPTSAPPERKHSFWPAQEARRLVATDCSSLPCGAMAHYRRSIRRGLSCSVQRSTQASGRLRAATSIATGGRGQRPGSIPWLTWRALAA
jgi:hypothetical protein